MNKPECPKNGPYIVKLKANKSYQWCSCGLSKAQPFCDGSHKSTKFSPQKISIDEEYYVNLCGCKKTKNPPYCDGSHRS